MVFSSATFLFLFLPVVILGQLLLFSNRLRNLFLLVASLFFYAWGEQLYVVILIISIISNYSFGLLINRYREKRLGAKLLLAFAVVVNLGILAIFKYSGFLVDNLNSFTEPLLDYSFAVGPVHMPIGISFFTFQAISYVVDIYRNNAEAQKNPFYVGLYISMFPQLIAGPIVRYKDIADQIKSRVVTWTGFTYGVERFVYGLAKKMILANSFGEVADKIFAVPPDHMNFSLAWLGVIMYTLQIYFDFSGYSDMAIGLGRMFGFKYLENFNYPYISRSMQEFWRRWHISLSNWFRDYLYFPLGGSRCSLWRTYFNLFIVFFLCGLWHGASWTFVLWGMYHGFFLVAERAGLSNILERTWRPIAHAYLLLAVMVGWALFRADTMEQATTFLMAMIGLGSGAGDLFHAWLYIDMELIILFMIGLIAATPLCKTVLPLHSDFESKDLSVKTGTYMAVSTLRTGFISLLLLFCWMSLASGSYNPFIYFRF